MTTSTLLKVFLTTEVCWPGCPLTLPHPALLSTPLPPSPLCFPPPEGVVAAGHPCTSVGRGVGRERKRGGGQIAQGRLCPLSLSPPPPCSSHLWQEKSCFPMLFQPGPRFKNIPAPHASLSILRGPLPLSLLRVAKVWSPSSLG